MIYNILHYSPFIFLLNVFINIKYELYLYAQLFLLLHISSLIYHHYYVVNNNNNNNNNNNKLMLIFDKSMIFIIVIYGVYIFYNKINMHSKNISLPINIYIYLCICITFLITCYLYIGGYYMNNFCFHKNIQIGNNYHALLHIISSIGHILIAIM
jgi:hypothetical protein